MMKNKVMICTFESPSAFDGIRFTKCKLEIIDGGEAIRTENMDGHFIVPPMKDHPFMMFGKSLNPDGAGRLITTSLVQEIISDDGKCVIFRTLNSTYKVTIN